MRLADLPTPAAIVDRARIRTNCDRMLKRVRRLHTRLRPHMKTMKSIGAARLALDPEHGGITVASLREAEYFAAHGIRDIFYALCVTPDKLKRAADVARRSPDFSLLIDDASMVPELRACAVAQGVRFHVWLEVDCGEHRTGVSPNGPALIDIAHQIAASPSLRLRGIATHAGHSYACRDGASLLSVAQHEREVAIECANQLREAGVDCPEVSVGSTPTAVAFDSANGLTEVRAGVYMAGDLFQAAIGSCSQRDLAFSVVASVLSRQPDTGRLLIDAGGLALSKDRSTALTNDDADFGRVVDIRGEPSFGNLGVTTVHQEHGQVGPAADVPFSRLQIGTRVRVQPNHVCMTAAMYQDLFVVEGSGDEIVDVWDRANGW